MSPQRSRYKEKTQWLFPHNFLIHSFVNQTSFCSKFSSASPSKVISLQWQQLLAEVRLGLLCLTAHCHHQQCFSKDPVVPPCSLCWLWSSPDPGQVTSACKIWRKLLQQKERGSLGSFLSFLPHWWASKVNLLLERSDNRETQRKAGLRRLGWGGKTVPLADCKFLDQIISFLPARRTSSYSWGTD